MLFLQENSQTNIESNYYNGIYSMAYMSDTLIQVVNYSQFMMYRGEGDDHKAPLRIPEHPEDLPQ